MTSPDAAELLAHALVALPAPAREVAERDAVGAVVADARHILAANGHFLALAGAPAGLGGAERVPWVRLTPPEVLPRDAHGIAQARIHGASDAYEKEYLLADGTRVPLLVGVGLLLGEPLPLFGLVARRDDAVAAGAVRAWTTAPDRDLRGAVASALH